MNIDKYIIELLEFQDHVVIPEFGAFVSNYVSASHDETTDTFSPPSRNVIFNANLYQNDGILAQHIVQKENIDFSKAMAYLTVYSTRLFEKLNRGQQLSFENLGNLSLNRQGKLNFDYTGNIKFLDTYGLDSYKFEKLTSEPIHISAPTVSLKQIGSGKRLAQIAASAVLLLSLSLLPSKNKLQIEHSNVNPIGILFESLIEEPEEQAVAIEKTIVETQDEIIKPFILVGGSFKKLTNATTYKNSLLNNGHQPEIIKSDNGLFRVAINSYINRETAINAMKSYRSEHQGSNVWVSLR